MKADTVSLVLLGILGVVIFVWLFIEALGFLERRRRFKNLAARKPHKTIGGPKKWLDHQRQRGLL